MQASKYIDQIITITIDVKCKQHQDGCQWIGKISQYDVRTSITGVAIVDEILGGEWKKGI